MPGHASSRCASAHERVERPDLPQQQGVDRAVLAWFGSPCIAATPRIRPWLAVATRNSMLSCTSPMSPIFGPSSIRIDRLLPSSTWRYATHSCKRHCLGCFSGKGRRSSLGPVDVDWRRRPCPSKSRPSKRTRQPQRRPRNRLQSTRLPTTTPVLESSLISSRNIGSRALACTVNSAVQGRCSDPKSCTTHLRHTAGFLSRMRDTELKSRTSSSPKTVAYIAAQIMPAGITDRECLEYESGISMSESSTNSMTSTSGRSMRLIE